MNRTVGISIASGIALSMLIGCGGDGDSGGADADVNARCTKDASACVTVHVPDDYDATPKKIIAGLFEELPPVGPPLVTVAIVEQPAIAPGMPYELEGTDLTDPGDYYLYVVLYNEGGGDFVPVSGVDYVASATQKRAFGTAPVNMPDMTLELYQE